jgi:hypothetical protein
LFSYSEEVKLYLPKALGGTMKRKKARKHPEAPKHPMSAYLYFVGMMVCRVHTL